MIQMPVLLAHLRRDRYLSLSCEFTVTWIDLELTKILTRRPTGVWRYRVAVSREACGVYLTVILNQVFLAASGTPSEGRILTALRKARRPEEGAASDGT
jgi:hypothetical protein